MTRKAKNYSPPRGWLRRRVLFARAPRRYHARTRREARPGPGKGESEPKVVFPLLGIKKKKKGEQNSLPATQTHRRAFGTRGGGGPGGGGGAAGGGETTFCLSLPGPAPGRRTAKYHARRRHRLPAPAGDGRGGRAGGGGAGRGEGGGARQAEKIRSECPAF